MVRKTGEVATYFERRDQIQDSPYVPRHLKPLLHAIHDRYGRNDCAWPGAKELARRVGIHLRSVRRQLAEAIDAGFIENAGRKLYGNPGRLVVAYRILWPAVLNGASVTSPTSVNAFSDTGVRAQVTPATAPLYPPTVRGTDQSFPEVCATNRKADPMFEDDLTDSTIMEDAPVIANTSAAEPINEPLVQPAKPARSPKAKPDRPKRQKSLISNQTSSKRQRKDEPILTEAEDAMYREFHDVWNRLTGGQCNGTATNEPRRKLFSGAHRVSSNGTTGSRSTSAIRTTCCVTTTA